MKKILIITLLVIPILLSSLTLDECIDLALENNKDLLKTSEQTKAAYANYRSIKGNLYPQITLSGMYGFQKTDFPEIAERTFPEKELPLNTSLSFEQILFSAGIFNGLEAARIYKNVQKENLDLAKQETIFQTRRLFYDVLLSKKVMEIQADALDITQEYFTQIQNKFKVGFASEYDLFRAELEMENQKPEVIEASKNYDLSIDTFKDFIGINDSEIEIEGKIELPKKEEFEIDKIIDEGLNNRLEITLSELNKDIYNVQYKNEKMNYLPQLFLKGSINSFTSTTGYSADSENFGTQSSISLGFSLPIFTGLTNYQNIKKTGAEYQIAKISYEDLINKVKIQIKNDYLNYNKELEKLKAGEYRVALSEKALSIAQSRYENQIGTVLEVTDAQLNHKTAKLNYLNQVYNIIKAHDTLKKSIGRNLKDE